MATVNAELGRRSPGNDHRHRRIADRRHAERAAPDTLDSELLTTAPTARSWAAMAVLVPGIVTQAGASADIQVTPQMTVFGGMGGRGNEGRMQVDGLNTGAALNGGGVSTYVADISNAAEVVTTTSGGLGEAEVGGPTLSIVPKSGGNRDRRAGLSLRRAERHGGQQLHDELKKPGSRRPASCSSSGTSRAVSAARSSRSDLVLRHGAR